MKRFRKALGIVALALVASLALAMPVSAWADETESYGKPDQVYGQGLRKR